jgi:hypothetical protein
VLYHLGFKPAYAPRGNAFLQMPLRCAALALFVPVNHLGSRYDLLKNYHELNAPASNDLELTIDDLKLAVRWEKRLFLMEIRREEPNRPRT